MHRIKPSPWLRWTALALLLGLSAASNAWGQAAEVGEGPQVQEFLAQVARNLFDSHGLMKTLGQPHFAIAAFITMNVIVFVETGLLIGFFLPGDSLLVTAGLICASPDCGWNLPLLLITLSLSAIIGDSIGYSIGYHSGPKIFNREESLFFHRDHLLKAQAFYEEHGGKTIILARFVPIIRTFAPVVAGVGRMPYARFLAYNVFGGIGWVFSLVLFGRYLPAILNPILYGLTGQEILVEHHVEKVILVVIAFSVLPIAIGWLRSHFGEKKPVLSPAPEAIAAEKP